MKKNESDNYRCPKCKSKLNLKIKSLKNDSVNEGELLDPGVYRLIFNVKDYFDGDGKECFYPRVVIVFETTDTSHYHVPLLLNPFGYSTYRGS